jgi:CBS-domain-containing membrane protein
MAFLSNALVMRKPVSRRIAYLGLFLSLAVTIVFPYQALNGFALVPKVFAAAALIGLPVFFSGLVFSRSFRDLARPSEALGVNLLGAVIGGTLENLVMIGGTRLLGVLAVALYLASAVSVPKSR